MTFKNGFLGGVAVGFLLTLIATGHIIIVEYTDNFRTIAYLVLFLIFLFGLAVTAYQAMKRQALFTPTWDGFITGFAFIETIIIFLISGRFIS
ncbi:hypothetical protein MUP77_22215 [Candidatus Bathyarchaeota archaeon]|nr:hypothetical protein [Candidatus Bathyarchaeota archaeon]